jgi:hypothetical protein
MRQVVVFAALLVVVACKKKDADAPPPTAQEVAPTEATAEPTPPPAPPAPPPAPVNLTADELKPTCAKIFTAELAAKTHGATEVKEEGNKGGGMTICQMFKDGELLGSATIACTPDLDPTAIERERGAMTKAKDLSPSIGRGGYRISSNFIFIDDETPCRLMVNWMTTPADDVWPDALRAIVAAVNPDTLK